MAKNSGKRGKKSGAKGRGRAKHEDRQALSLSRLIASDPQSSRYRYAQEKRRSAIEKRAKLNFVKKRVLSRMGLLESTDGERESNHRKMLTHECNHELAVLVTIQQRQREDEHDAEDNDGEQEHRKKDPLAEAKKKWEERKQQLMQQQQEEAERIREAKHKKRERFKKKRMYQSKLPNGQPRLKYQIFDLLQKVKDTSTRSGSESDQ